MRTVQKTFFKCDPWGITEDSVKRKDEYIKEESKSSWLTYSCHLCDNAMSSTEFFNIHKLIYAELNRFICSEKIPDC